MGVWQPNAPFQGCDQGDWLLIVCDCMPNIPADFKACFSRHSEQGLLRG
jgi:hypothetical protein